MKKIIFYPIFTLFAVLLSFLIIRLMFPNNALLNKTIKQNVSNTASWKTYQLDKQYKSAALHFKLNYPQEWQPKEEGESVVWYSTEKQKIFTVSWLNPDIIYDIEDICRFEMCNKIAEVLTVQNITIEILKPTQDRQKAFKLSDSYLQGNIVGSNSRIIPSFVTGVLSADDFKAILVTFSFID